MSRILVTGATGFIGHHLLNRLYTTARHIRCLIRPIERADFHPPEGIEVVLGDMTQPETLANVADGIDVIYHLAGSTVVISPKWHRYVNAEGTRHLIDACRKNTTPPTLLYVSSLAAGGPSTGDEPRLESQPPRPVSMYGRSKLRAERYLRMAAEWLPCTVIRPCSVIGPGEEYIAKLFRTLRSGYNPIPGFRDLRTSWVYVDDLISAMTLAVKSGQRLAQLHSGAEPGRGVYYISMDEAPSITELANVIADIMGIPRPWTIYTPKFLCWFSGLFNMVRAHLQNYPYLIMPDKVREIVGGSWVCSNEKAKRELGFACRVGLREGFERIYDWYRANGIL